MSGFFVPSTVLNVRRTDFLQCKNGGSGGERWTSASSSTFLPVEFGESGAFRVQQPVTNDLKELCEVCVVTLAMRKVLAT